MCFRTWWLYLALLIPFTVSAEQTINGVKISAIGSGRATILPNGTVLNNIGFQTQVGSNPPTFTQRAVNFTKGQTAGSIKNFAKGNAFQIGLTVGILGIGWAMDELTGQIYSSTGTQPEPLGATYWTCITGCPNGITPQMAWSTVQLASAAMIGKTINAYSTQLPLNVVNGYTSCPTPSCTALMGYTSPGSGTPNNQIWGIGFYKATVANPVNSNPVTAPTPATDDEIVTQVVPQLSQPALDKLHTDPVTGAVEENQAVLDKMTEIANEEALKANPQAQPVVAPVAGDTTLTNEQPQTAQPAFCIYAKVLCDWIDWTQEPPETDDPEMPETDLHAPLAWTSGQSNGQCPNDKNLNLHFVDSQSFNYQPICSLAIGMRPLVIASSGIFAMFILSGFSRRKEST